jgi:hypothetical protein
MLDDNAQLLRLYAHHARVTGSVVSGRVADQVAEFLLRELRLGTGAVAASLDADTGGIEGATYRWTPRQLVEVLGQRDGAAAAELFALPAAGDAGTPTGRATEDTSRPTGHDGDDLASEVLRLPTDPDDPRWFDSVRHRLVAARDRRRQPGRDDIVVLRSNGLAITALAEAGAAADRPAWVAAAAAAADYLLAVHLVDGDWFRSSRDGNVGPGRAVLADLGDLACGLPALYQATGEVRWLREGNGVIDYAVRHFADDGDAPSGGSGRVAAGFFDTTGDAAGLILRPRDPTDGAAPSGLSAITHALLTAAALTGNAGYRALGRCIGVVGGRAAATVSPVRRLAPGGRRGAAGRAAADRGGRRTRPSTGRACPRRATPCARRIGDRGRPTRRIRACTTGAATRDRRGSGGLRLPGVRLRPSRHRRRCAARSPAVTQRGTPRPHPTAGPLSPMRDLSGWFAARPGPRTQIQRTVDTNGISLHIKQL